MSRKRSLFLVISGALLGALVTVLIFSLCNRPRTSEPPARRGDPVLEDDPDEAAAGSEGRGLPGPPDLEGDCVLSGSVIAPGSSR